MNEGTFYRDHVVRGLGKHVHLCRVENSLESGTPDVSYAVGTRQGWVETKIVRSGRLHFEKYQLPWLRRRSRYCNTGLWVLAAEESGSTLYMWPASSVLLAPRERVMKWLVVEVDSIEPFLKMEKPWLWQEVLEWLKSTQ